MSEASKNGSSKGFESWWIAPRDPLVFGDGGRSPALLPRKRWWLPPPTTFAGFVRARLVAGEAQPGSEQAHELLEVKIRGPWLAERRADRASELWLPVPADLVLDPRNGQCLRPRPLKPGQGEGALWPDGVELTPVAVPGRLPDDPEIKTERPDFPYWRFEDLLRWSLGREPKAPPLRRDDRPYPVDLEGRVHVAIDPGTRTAEPEALFSSGGLRFRDGFGLLAEVRGASSAAAPSLAVLGGESRAVRCELLSDHAFPPFPGDHDPYRSWFEKRLEEIEPPDLGLRIQLITPGWFGGWLPRWPDELAGHLRSVVSDRYLALSGWSLQAIQGTGKERRPGPRAVRRLVPAGAVYTFGGFDSPAQVLGLCRKLWGRSLYELAEQKPQGDPDTFLAPPGHDGYGQLLAFPCPCPRPRRTPEENP
jgi:hypothetical protein